MPLRFAPAPRAVWHSRRAATPVPSPPPSVAQSISPHRPNRRSSSHSNYWRIGRHCCCLHWRSPLEPRALPATCCAAYPIPQPPAHFPWSRSRCSPPTLLAQRQIPPPPAPLRHRRWAHPNSPWKAWHNRPSQTKKPPNKPIEKRGESWPRPNKMLAPMATPPLPLRHHFYCFPFAGFLCFVPHP